ncbi:hypothetical protein MRX96_011415 [Rhipicephalus microplus]
MAIRRGHLEVTGTTPPRARLGTTDCVKLRAFTVLLRFFSRVVSVGPAAPFTFRETDRCIQRSPFLQRFTRHVGYRYASHIAPPFPRQDVVVTGGLEQTASPPGLPAHPAAPTEPSCVTPTRPWFSGVAALASTRSSMDAASSVRACAASPAADRGSLQPSGAPRADGRSCSATNGRSTIFKKSNEIAGTTRIFQ